MKRIFRVDSSGHPSSSLPVQSNAMNRSSLCDTSDLILLQVDGYTCIGMRAKCPILYSRVQTERVASPCVSHHFQIEKELLRPPYYLPTSEFRCDELKMTSKRKQKENQNQKNAGPEKQTWVGKLHADNMPRRAPLRHNSQTTCYKQLICFESYPIDSCLT